MNNIKCLKNVKHKIPQKKQSKTTNGKKQKS